MKAALRHLRNRAVTFGRRSDISDAAPTDEGGFHKDQKAGQQTTAALRHLRNRAVILGRRSETSDAAPTDDGGVPKDQKAGQQMTAALRHLRNRAVIFGRRSHTSDAVPTDDGGVPKDQKARQQMKAARRNLRNRAVTFGRLSDISDAAPTDEGGVPKDQKARQQMKAAFRNLRNRAVTFGRLSDISDAAPADEGGIPKDQKARPQMRAARRNLRCGAERSDTSPSSLGGAPRACGSLPKKLQANDFPARNVNPDRDLQIPRDFPFLYGMGRRLRWVPEEGALVDVTCRTVQGRRLFRPSPELNEIVLGVLGRAQRLYPIRICGLAVLSSHVHLLLDVENGQQVSDFMEYACSNMAREVGRLTDWDGPVFAGRYHAIIVSPEERAQAARLAYCLAQGCKENLVERIRDWPGVHCARALLDGELLKGYWFDRSKEYAAHRRGEDFDRYRYATEETVHLSPLPCWQHLSDEAYQERVAALVDEVEEEAAEERRRTGNPVLGVAAILAQAPQYRPAFLDRSPCPLFLTASYSMWRTLYEAYAWFVLEFRAAAEKLRAGDRGAPFPRGSFPPALPFVGG